MLPSLAGYLAPLRPHLVPGLCSEDELGALLEIAASLPAAPAGGFERRLGPHGSGLDLAICVRTGQLAARELREDGRGGAAVQALLAAVHDPQSALYEALDLVWLEYDASRGGRTPSLFVGPRAVNPCDAILGATELVLGRAVEDKVVRELRRLASPLSDVALVQVGWMLGRSKPGLRLCFCANSVAAFQGLLDRLGCARQRSLLRECCDHYAPHVTQFMLAVDIGEGEIGPRVGLEFGFRGAKHAVPLQRWDDLLLALERDGLCTRALRRALLRWPGRMVEADDPEHWPAHLHGANALLDSYALRIDRLLHHVKLVVEDHDIIEAKVYFGIIQGWAPA